ncbi:LPD7 domain-containing protein [Brevundimonas sp.]|uniref:LPD7 domain-containing protein n=1 Tax=Brevundimonas sp. TaxID=1871086 RepID=UPI00257D0E28|nr:LPD7 domain-containing protein [Brevundimonas sp.]
MTEARPAPSSGNRISPRTASSSERRSLDKGDVPAQLLDRYLVERDRQGRPERYYRDHKTADPSFRDHGRALSSHQAYPDSVAAMLRIAQHRGWSNIKATGDDAFRREVWVQARTLGLEVAGYRPTERDRQAANEALQPNSQRDASRQKPPARDDIKRRLEMAAVVVRTLIADPAAQARLMERAWARVRPEADRARDKPDREQNRRAERRRER